MNNKFFESVYKAALDKKLNEGHLKEMAVASAEKVKAFCDIHPEFVDLYKNPMHSKSGTPEWRQWNDLLDEYYSLHPEDEAAERTDRFGNIKHQGRGTAIANALQPIADRILAQRAAGKETPESALERAASHIRQAQLILDKNGHKDSDAAILLQQVSDALSDMMVIPAPAVEETPEPAAAEPEPEVTPEPSVTEPEPEPSASEPDPFSIEGDDDTGINIDDDINLDDIDVNDIDVDDLANMV